MIDPIRIERALRQGPPSEPRYQEVAIPALLAGETGAGRPRSLGLRRDVERRPSVWAIARAISVTSVIVAIAVGAVFVLGSGGPPIGPGGPSIISPSPTVLPTPGPTFVPTLGPQSPRPTAAPPTDRGAPPIAVATPRTGLETPIPGRCAADDLSIVFDRTEGAAGTRFISATITNGSSGACDVRAGLQAFIVDPANDAIVQSDPIAPETGTVPLMPGGPVPGTVRWTNWCGDPPRQPLFLQVVIDDGSRPGVLDVRLPADVATPPCTDPGAGPGTMTPFQLEP